MSENTRDLSKFGMRELAIAGDLLREYSNGTCDFLTDGVTVEFNPNSGVVFLTDEDYNVGVLEDGALVQFHYCGDCGWEGTEDDLENETEEYKKLHTLKNGYLEHVEEEEAK